MPNSTKIFCLSMSVFVCGKNAVLKPFLKSYRNHPVYIQKHAHTGQKSDDGPGHSSNFEPDKR